MTPCPKCGAQDWKTTTEQRQWIYKSCGNCKYSPALEKAEPHRAKEWVEATFKEHEELVQENIAREQEIHDTPKPTTLQYGKLSRAKRLLAISDIKIHLAEAVSEVVDMTETGQITIIIPSVGMYQFEWGEFDVFRVIGGS